MHLFDQGETKDHSIEKEIIYTPNLQKEPNVVHNNEIPSNYNDEEISNLWEDPSNHKPKLIEGNMGEEDFNSKKGVITKESYNYLLEINLLFVWRIVTVKL